MILLLLNCFISLQANDEHTFPSTGETLQTDTVATVPIRLIRIANDKMIERNYLEKVTIVQDSIICLNQDYINNQDSIINDLKNKIADTNRINADLQKAYEKERKKKVIYGSVAGGLTVGIAASILIGVFVNK